MCPSLCRSRLPKIGRGGPKLDQQSRQQVLRAYRPNIYTVIQEESSGFFQLDVHHPDSPYGLIQDVLKPVFRQDIFKK